MLYLFGVVLLLSCVLAKITIDKIEACVPDSDYDISFTHNVINGNDLQILEDGSLNTKVELSDNILDLLHMYVFEDGQWKPFMNLQDTFCQTTVRYFPSITRELEKAAGVTQSCPYPAGEYKVANVPLDFEKIDYSFVPRGKLMINATLSDLTTGKMLSCETVEFTVTD